jgi:ABC-type phosphate/phosphonate transport system substrate-binding protein
MRKQTALFLIVVMAALMAVSTAVAAQKEVVIYVTRLGGDGASAQPYVDKFMRYIETEAGWVPMSLGGSFMTSRREAVSFIEGNKPALGIMDPQLYFEMRKSLNLQPILQVVSKDLVSEKLNVVVKDPSIKSLADLKGKRVWTMLADYPRYLSKVVLDGKADAGAEWKLKQVGQALKGVRALFRGDCDATILDDDQLARAREIEGGKDLRIIYTSPVLPPIPVVATGVGLTADEKSALIKTFKSMCDSEKGAVICKEMHMNRLVPVDEAAFAAARKRYGE